MISWYQNVGFRWKLTLPMILSVVLFIYTAIYSIRSSGTLAENAETIAKVNFPEIELLMQADRDLYQALTAERALLSGRWTEPEWRALVIEHTENIEQAHDRMLESFGLSNTSTEAEKQEFLRHLQTWKNYSTALIAEAQSSGGE